MLPNPAVPMDPAAPVVIPKPKSVLAFFDVSIVTTDRYLHDGTSNETWVRTLS
jgi:hypothetical protein